MENITNLKLNEEAIIYKINCTPNLKNRLLSLGFVEGETIKVLGISSLNKTYLLNIQGSALAIRSSTLKDVLICKK